jgi:hypothetical protein
MVMKRKLVIISTNTKKTWNITELTEHKKWQYNKKLSSQCNLTAQIEHVEDTYRSE